MQENTRNKIVSYSLRVININGHNHIIIIIGQVPPDLQCKTPGCFRQRYMNEQGAYFDYCGKFCRDNGGKPLEPMHASGK